MFKFFKLFKFFKIYSDNVLIHLIFRCGMMGSISEKGERAFIVGGGFEVVLGSCGGVSLT